MENAVVIIEQETKAVAQQAFEIVIKSQAQYDDANVFLRAVKELQKRIHEEFDPIVDACHKAHKEATTKRKAHLDPAQHAERVAKNKMIIYSNEQEKIAREAQAKLDAAAEKKRKEEEERAKKWADKGNEAKAKEICDNAEAIAAPQIAPRVVSAAGQSFRFKYSGLVIDAALVPKEYTMPDQKKIDGMARVMKDSFNIPGVKLIKEKILASRGA